MGAELTIYLVALQDTALLHVQLQTVTCNSGWTESLSYHRLCELAKDPASAPELQAYMADRFHCMAN